MPGSPSCSGRTDDARRYRELAGRIRKAFIAKFFHAETGRFDAGTQACQAFALHYDLVPPEHRQAVLKVLVDEVQQHHQGHVATGIFGTQYLLETLCRLGRADVAYGIVNQKTFPGWGHMLDRGATTLWEHWEFSDNVFSHNHPMFGSVSQWFFEDVGGIRAEDGGRRLRSHRHSSRRLRRPDPCQGPLRQHPRPRGLRLAASGRSAAHERDDSVRRPGHGLCADERRFLDQRRRQADLAGPRREASGAGAGGGRFSRLRRKLSTCIGLLPAAETIGDAMEGRNEGSSLSPWGVGWGKGRRSKLSQFCKCNQVVPSPLTPLPKGEGTLHFTFPTCEAAGSGRGERRATTQPRPSAR